MKKSFVTLFFAIAVMIGMQVPTAVASSEHNGNNNPVAFSLRMDSCIAGVFRAQEDDWTGTLSLWSNCTFKFVEREGREINSTEGTYSIDGDVTPGSIATITFYVNGRNYGQATLAWPLEGGLQVLMNGYSFTKI